MADEEHLKILKEGVEAWNAWRKEHPKVKADLCDANLREVNLSKADLINADLTGTDLRHASAYSRNDAGFHHLDP